MLFDPAASQSSTAGSNSQRLVDLCPRMPSCDFRRLIHLHKSIGDVFKAMEESPVGGMLRGVGGLNMADSIRRAQEELANAEAEVSAKQGGLDKVSFFNSGSGATAVPAYIRMKNVIRATQNFLQQILDDEVSQTDLDSCFESIGNGKMQKLLLPFLRKIQRHTSEVIALEGSESAETAPRSLVFSPEEHSEMDSFDRMLTRFMNELNSDRNSIASGGTSGAASAGIFFSSGAGAVSPAAGRTPLGVSPPATDWSRFDDVEAGIVGSPPLPRHEPAFPPVDIPTTSRPPPPVPSRSSGLNLDAVFLQLLNTNTLPTSMELLELAAEARTVFSNEPKVVYVAAPCVVVGDVHGQLRDLRKAFSLGGPLGMVRYLFLGDYVDRGPWSTHCAALLLAAKLKFPDRVFLIRGNHETREINGTYGFLGELKNKFPQYNVEGGHTMGGIFCTEGNTLWDAFNEVFDKLPLAAVVDNSIFCVHGGLSRSVQYIEDILSVNESDDIENVIGDLTWSDPGNNRQFQLSPRGNGLRFGSDVTKAFVRRNNLKFICRAHQCVMGGYQWTHEGRLVTLFSASHYVGGKNMAAIMKVRRSVHSSPEELPHDDTGLKASHADATDSHSPLALNVVNSAASKSAFSMDLSAASYFSHSNDADNQACPEGNVSPRDCNSIHLVDSATRGFKTDHELDMEYCTKKELGELPEEPFDVLEFCVFDVDEDDRDDGADMMQATPRPDSLPNNFFS